MNISIIGAGIIGSSIGYKLSLNNNITIIDKSNEISNANGASRNTFAYLNSFNKNPLYYHKLNHKSMKSWNKFQSDLHSDIGLRWGGMLKWENEPVKVSLIRDRVNSLNNLGYNVKLIDKEYIKILEPNLNIKDLEIAAYSEEEGTVEPELVIKTCLEKIVNNNGIQYLGHNVKKFTTKCTKKSKYITHIHTDNNIIETDLVVLTAGIESTKLAKSIGINIPQVKSPGMLVKTSPIEPILNQLSIIYAPGRNNKLNGVHFKQLIDGSLIIGEEHSESSKMDSSDKHALDLIKRVKYNLHSIDEIDNYKTSLVYRPMPVDGLPILGISNEIKNLYIAVMHSGVTLAPLIASAVSDEINNNSKLEFLNYYRPSRFKQ